MAAIVRVVVPSCPHHITQRRNRRVDTFFYDQDYRAYLSLMAERCFRLHLIAVPKSEDGLRRTIGDVHRR